MDGAKSPSLWRVEPDYASAPMARSANRSQRLPVSATAMAPQIAITKRIIIVITSRKARFVPPGHPFAEIIENFDSRAPVAILSEVCQDDSRLRHPPRAKLRTDPAQMRGIFQGTENELKMLPPSHVLYVNRARSGRVE